MKKLLASVAIITAMTAASAQADPYATNPYGTNPNAPASYEPAAGYGYAPPQAYAPAPAPAPAYSGNGRSSFPYWYLGLEGGVAAQDTSDVSGTSKDLHWKTGYDVGASIGYQQPALFGFRPEIEYTFHQQDFKGGNDVDVQVAAANLYYDFLNPSVITPYIGGGIGYGHFRADSGTSTTLPDGSSNRAIYQGIVGIAYDPVNIPDVTLDLQYRYLAPFSDPKAGGIAYDYDNHSIEAGAKFRF